MTESHKYLARTCRSSLDFEFLDPSRSELPDSFDLELPGPSDPDSEVPVSSDSELPVYSDPELPVCSDSELSGVQCTGHTTCFDRISKDSFAGNPPPP